jgi:hypothetical protein
VRRNLAFAGFHLRVPAAPFRLTRRALKLPNCIPVPLSTGPHSPVRCFCGFCSRSTAKGAPASLRPEPSTIQYGRGMRQFLACCGRGPVRR